MRPVFFLKATLLSLLLLAGGNAFALDVNRATSEELQTVEGVGPVIAQRIIKERSRGGKFASNADLMERVNGVGEKTAGRITAGSGLKKGTRSSSKKTPTKKTATKKVSTRKATDTKTSSKKKTAKKAKKKTTKKKTTKKQKTTGS